MKDEDDLFDVVAHVTMDALWGANVGVVLPRTEIGPFMNRVLDTDFDEHIAKVYRANGGERIYFKNGGLIVFFAESAGVGRGYSMQRLYLRHGASQEVRQSAIPMVATARKSLVVFF